MTATDPTLEARQAVVTHLRADTNVTGTAVGTRLYGERQPASVVWPFMRYGQSAMGQLGGSIVLHFFSKAKFTDEVAGIMKAVVASLGDRALTMDDGRKIRLVYPDAGGSQIIPDGAEADAWHGILRLDAFIARDCVAA